jgi:hypothetical protein
MTRGRKVPHSGDCLLVTGVRKLAHDRELSVNNKREKSDSKVRKSVNDQPENIASNQGNVHCRQRGRKVSHSREMSVNDKRKK